MENKSIDTLLKDFKAKYSSKYEILSDKSLGDGAYGVVYKAWDIDRKLDVAIKFYHDGIVPEGSERGWNLSSKTINRQIAPTYTIESFISNETECKAVVSRLIPGKSLKATFNWWDIQNAENKQLIADDLVHTFLPSLLNVLELCHSLGFGHGDLHEGNVMIFSTGVHEKFHFDAVLIDFDNSSIQVEELCRTEEEKIEKDCRLFKNRLGRYIMMDWVWQEQVETIFTSYEAIKDFRIAFDIILKYITLIEKKNISEQTIIDILKYTLPYKMSGFVEKGVIDVLTEISIKAQIEKLFQDSLSKFNNELKKYENWQHEVEVTMTVNGSAKATLYNSFFG
ncbi:MAG TPA: hypothetical protein VLB84_16155 [Bacteroidia bacterium]|nr:hypothetical protein [Bacteroidia bacterium]